MKELAHIVSQKNLIPSDCGFPSTSTAGLEVEEADLWIYLAAEHFVGGCCSDDCWDSQPP